MEHVRFGQREDLGPGRSWSARLPVQVRRRPDLVPASADPCLLVGGRIGSPRSHTGCRTRRSRQSRVPDPPGGLAAGPRILTQDRVIELLAGPPPSGPWRSSERLGSDAQGPAPQPLTLRQPLGSASQPHPLISIVGAAADHLRGVVPAAVCVTEEAAHNPLRTNLLIAGASGAVRVATRRGRDRRLPAGG